MRSVTLNGISGIAAAIALCACGGGGGGGGTSGGGGGGLPPAPTPTPAFTTASGKVVSDTNGAALGGVKVALRPWSVCTAPTPSTVSCPTPLPAPQATTAPDGTFTLANAPNGHYMLIIGNDVPGDATTTTVHDQITLNGGAQTLTAPILPPVPTVTPPAWETSGSYRIGAVDPATEAPCFNEFNLKRQANALPQVVADEWLTENIRDYTRYVVSGTFVVPPWAGNMNGGLADLVATIAGGSSCAQMVDPTFAAGSPALDPRTLWFAGYYNNVAGRGQFPLDPATVPSTVGIVWP